MNVILVFWHKLYFHWRLLLFKVYVKQSWIWDTLPTCKIELFVTMGIFKVIFCRLMILYTQYSPMSFFSVPASYWFHSVPSGYTWKHLRWHSFWQWLLLILYSIEQWYYTHSLFYGFLVFFVSVCCWFPLVPGGSSLFQIIPGSSSSFQVVPPCSSSFLLLQCAYSDSDFIHLYSFHISFL